MDNFNWIAWTVFFLSVSFTVTVLAALGIDEQIDEVLIFALILGVVCALFVFLSRGREIRHRERMAMIEKGIYVDAGQQGSGVPSLAVILLVGIGLAAVIASDVEYLGYALLFVGIGLIVRSILLNQRRRDRESPAPARSEEAPETEEAQSNEEAPETEEAQSNEEAPKTEEAPETEEAQSVEESTEPARDDKDGTSPRKPDGV